jgi:hypothetical protein
MDDWEELRDRGTKAKQHIVELLGGLLSFTEAAALLSVNLPTLEHGKHTMLAVPDTDGDWAFPRMQFTQSCRVRAGIAEVAKVGARIDPWVVLSVLVDDVPDGSAMLLEKLDDPAVLRDVLHRLDTYGEHVAS